MADYFGTNISDFIPGMEVENDRIFGLEDDDLLQGEHLLLSGIPDRDQLFGNTGNDVLKGQ